jgi:hypothetical protein
MGPEGMEAVGGASKGSVVEDEVLALVVKLSNYVTRREAQVQVGVCVGGLIRVRRSILVCDCVGCCTGVNFEILRKRH